MEQRVPPQILGQSWSKISKQYNYRLLNKMMELNHYKQSPVFC